MTPQQGLRMQTRKAMRSRTVIRPLSCQSSTQGRSTRRSDRAWSCTPSAPRGGSKLARVIALVERDHGATIEELIAATGWLAHMTRAALTGLFHDAGGVRRAARRDRHGARLVG
ncbi:MAG: DUF3489 domain-containing protein [Roseiarcus sp.]